MEKKLWYAVSNRGQGRVFTTCPVRNEHFGIWEGESVGCVSMLVMLLESEGFKLPDIKFDDNPVELTLSMNYG